MSLNNLVLFDENDRLHKYDSTLDILEAYYPVRLRYYELRKALLVRDLRIKLKTLENQTRFMKLVCDTTFGVVNRKKSEKVRELRELGFPTLEELRASIAGADADAAAEEDVDPSDTEDAAMEPEPDVPAAAKRGGKKNGAAAAAAAAAPAAVAAPAAAATARAKTGYEYLLNQSLTNLDEDEIAELGERHVKAQTELEATEAESVKNLWRRDLDRLVFEYEAYEAQRKLDLIADDDEGEEDEEDDDDSEDKKKKKQKKPKKKPAAASAKKGGGGKRKRKGEEEEEEETCTTDILSTLEVELVAQVLPPLPEKKKRQKKNPDAAAAEEIVAQPLDVVMVAPVEVDDAAK